MDSPPLPPRTPQSQPPSAQFTNALLVASGSAFVAGIMGSLWYQSRKDRRNPSSIQPRATNAQGQLSASVSTQPSMPRPGLQSMHDVRLQESLLKEGRLLGLKAFAIATTLCLSGAFLVVGGTRWALEVETIPQFSEKMRNLFPKQKQKFVDAVVGADQSVFGTHEPPSKTATSPAFASSGEAENGGAKVYDKDLDHEEDGNLLGRLEQELLKMEAADLENQ